MNLLLLIELLAITRVLCKDGGGGGSDDHGGGGGHGDDHGQTAQDTSTSPTTSTAAGTSAAITSTKDGANPSSNPSPTLPAIPQNPGLRFLNPDNTSTCSSTTFFWTVTGDLAKESVALSVTNQGVQSYTPSEPLIHSFASNVSTDAQLFTWLRVDVPSGWYKAQADFANGTMASQSPAFFVFASTNTSCLGNNSEPAYSTPSTTLPGGHQLPKAELVGIIIGSMAGVAILVMAFAFPQLWRHALVSPKTRIRPYRRLR
ncbi:hypothetical protein AAF712_002450 [Marasmius tenuissimus]|uniref:Uncharacterized protein n=1 Tax=Marasmius tenuissimus TaxID=585030 RepID=A0ABR3AB97_9AGAR